MYYADWNGLNVDILYLSTFCPRGRGGGGGYVKSPRLSTRGGGGGQKWSKFDPRSC